MWGAVHGAGGMRVIHINTRWGASNAFTHMFVLSMFQIIEHTSRT